MTDGICFGKNMSHIYSRVVGIISLVVQNVVFCAPRKTVGLSIDGHFFLLEISFEVVGESLMKFISGGSSKINSGAPLPQQVFMYFFENESATRRTIAWCLHIDRKLTTSKHKTMLWAEIYSSSIEVS